MPRPRALFWLVAFGLVLRLVVVIAAEHRLDSDEVVVGTMALDILEGNSAYFFYADAAYNMTHEWAHLHTSVLYSLFSPRRPRQPLDAEQMFVSTKFVFGMAWPLLTLGLAVAGTKLLRGPRTPLVAHIGLAHLVVYLSAYWLNGLRYLPVPPSRVLYVTAMSMALVLPYALEPGAASRWLRRASRVAVCLWIVLVGLPVVQWVTSGVPREHGSWRGSWSLTDGAALHAKLAEEGIEVVYTSLWTGNSLEFATRAARHEDPSVRLPLVAPALPLPPGLRAAVVLRDGTPLARRIVKSLEERGVMFRPIRWQHFLILSDIESARVDPQLGIPWHAVGFHTRDWLPYPVPPDGFN